jgi:hypothetical protein
MTCPWTRAFAVVSSSHRAPGAEDGNINSCAPLKKSHASVCAAALNMDGW